MKITPSMTSVLAGLALAISPAGAQTLYTVANTAGGSWNTVYAQGFSTSLGATPIPGAVNGDPVALTQFQFFKSGNADAAASIQLAIFNTMYPNTVGLTTGSSSFVGLSANTIASTGPLSTGDTITFAFNNLALTYGNDYSAVFVNVSGNALTPVLVSALTANYALQGDGFYHPVVNYGTESQYEFVTSNFINAGYFSAFSFAGDANFNASLTTVPEPASVMLLGTGMAFLMIRRLRARQ